MSAELDPAAAPLISDLYRLLFRLHCSLTTGSPVTSRNPAPQRVYVDEEASA